MNFIQPKLQCSRCIVQVPCTACPVKLQSTFCFSSCATVLLAGSVCFYASAYLDCGCFFLNSTLWSWLNLINLHLENMNLVLHLDCSLQSNVIEVHRKKGTNINFFKSTLKKIIRSSKKCYHVSASALSVGQHVPDHTFFTTIRLCGASGWLSQHHPP